MKKIRHNLWWISILCTFAGPIVGLPARNPTQLFIGFGLLLAGGICACFMPKEV